MVCQQLLMPAKGKKACCMSGSALRPGQTSNSMSHLIYCMAIASTVSFGLNNNDLIRNGTMLHAYMIRGMLAEFY